MSHLGKMYRGELLYSKRNRDGNLPKVITMDSHKMEEIDYFLKNSEEVKETPIKEVKKASKKGKEE